MTKEVVAPAEACEAADPLKPLAASRGFIPAPEPASEEKRLETLAKYGILDTAAEQAYDDLTLLASTICGVPISLVSLVDRNRQWFKSRIGMDDESNARELSFCAHAILEPDRLFIVPDASEDRRFAGSPLVLGDPHIRFYAGAPLVTQEGTALGTICVIDRKPRVLSEEQKIALQCLARQVVAQLELRQAMAQLEQQNLSDALTGVGNRRSFNQRLVEQTVLHMANKRSLSLLMIDIDHFKSVNDLSGHAEGDQVLMRTAKLLESSSRPSDFVARYGGEEFAIILPETDGKNARLVAERIRMAVKTASWQSHLVTVSLGVASMYPAQNSDRNLLVSRADQALYRAKRSGRDRVEVFAA